MKKCRSCSHWLCASWIGSRCGFCLHNINLLYIFCTSFNKACIYCKIVYPYNSSKRWLLLVHPCHHQRCKSEASFSWFLGGYHWFRVYSLWLYYYQPRCAKKPGGKQPNWVQSVTVQSSSVVVAKKSCENVSREIHCSLGNYNDGEEIVSLVINVTMCCVCFV